ncbi:hypothetical protein CNYM01_08977 [Colletotrichum nymphaeae SA-01]|uniref:F-box domain-containing protein n=1 Tax=Colletotrichum nymphaeae SA-01 TaxID=1460502 RepID=A0A135UYL6_9PEZI|nr:hypothetical protein CNYM01_08977 [Colletotrichum nymphaeae SA-01]
MCLGISTFIRAWRERGLERNEDITENQDLYDLGKKIVGREPSATEEMRMPCVPDSGRENIDGDTSDEGLVDTDWETIASDSDTSDGAYTCKITGQNTIHSTSGVEVLMPDLPSRIYSWEAKLIANLRQSRFISLPDEILLQIMHESELSDLYMLRQTTFLEYIKLTEWLDDGRVRGEGCEGAGILPGLPVLETNFKELQGRFGRLLCPHRTFKQLMEPIDPDSELFILEGRPNPPLGVRSAFSWAFSRSQTRDSKIVASNPRYVESSSSHNVWTHSTLCPICDARFEWSLERGSIYLTRSGGEFTPKVNDIYDWEDEPYGLSGILASEPTSCGADNDKGLSWQSDTTKRNEYYSPGNTLLEAMIQRVQQFETEDTQTDWKEYIKTLAPVITTLFNLVTSGWLRRKVKNYINKIRKSSKHKEPSSKEKLDSTQIHVN